MLNIARDRPKTLKKENEKRLISKEKTKNEKYSNNNNKFLLLFFYIEKLYFVRNIFGKIRLIYLVYIVEFALQFSLHESVLEITWQAIALVL